MRYNFIMLTLAVLFCPLNAHASSSASHCEQYVGAIVPTETFDSIANEVQPLTRPKGRLEKTIEYQNRIDAIQRGVRLDRIVTIPMKTTNLQYNADKEAFIVNVDDFGQGIDHPIYPAELDKYFSDDIDIVVSHIDTMMRRYRSENSSRLSP